MSSNDNGSGKSFWTTLPGILAGIAALITALVGLYVALNPRPESIDGGTQPTIQPTIQPTTPQEFRVVETFLRADPFNYDGPCPVTIKFSGRISVAGGSGTVAYKILRSDGASAPVKSITFSGPGGQDLESTWQLGASYSGWQQIQILDPAEEVSEKAEFTIQCR
jgi:hypothetical protein